LEGLKNLLGTLLKVAIRNLWLKALLDWRPRKGLGNFKVGRRNQPIPFTIIWGPLFGPNWGKKTSFFP